ncbi:MAG: helix-turn-helix domain-containing protein [Proteobacteria bacterium]|nr:helix-turn-helix domain-containing protein [Pseudomonadota bacterium]
MPGKDAPSIGPHVQQLRKRRGMTLDGLAALSGVSRSMLSQIERGQANPTLATVWGLARALKIDVSELIGVAPSDNRVKVEITQASFVPEIRTEDRRCVLRILSPAHRAGSVEWYELAMEAGGALRSEAHAKGAREHLTVLEGAMAVEVGGERFDLGAGATARYPVDVPHAIVNAGPGVARALLVVTS